MPISQLGLRISFSWPEGSTFDVEEDAMVQVLSTHIGPLLINFGGEASSIMPGKVRGIAYKKAK